MATSAILVLATGLLLTLLYFDHQSSAAKILPTKTSLSLLFIVAAGLQPSSIAAYYTPILVGLAFCLGGDICLALPQKRMFLVGLVSFLIGHICYIIGFYQVAHPDPGLWAGYLVLAALGGGVFFWLKPHLGTMVFPVLLYVIIITLMVGGAGSVLLNQDLSLTGRMMAFGGAMAFYFSDIFVARDRFLKESFSNRLFGLPLYYGGQFLLAFSIGVLK